MSSRHDAHSEHASSSRSLTRATEGRVVRPAVAQVDHPVANALRERIAGEVRFDRGSRGLWASDASNYHEIPVGVVLPHSIEDVVATLEVCHAHGVHIVNRGGGTGLAGQTVNTGAVVIDFSKYLRSVLEIDAQARLVRVEPGIVLDALREALEPHGLTLGPDPATHDRCTIGGMLGNNSCGIHSVHSEYYGPGPRMEDQVESLDILTHDGLRMRVGKTSEAQLAQILSEGGRRAGIYRGLVDLRDRYAGLIRARYPDIPRRVSGYNLPALLPENGFDVAKALVGSESTCVTILEASLKLIERRPERALLVVGYESVYDAGDHVPLIRALDLKPVGCEGIDQQLVDFIHASGLHEKTIGDLPEGHGWLFVEFGDDEKARAVEAAREAMRALRGARKPPVSMKLITDEACQHNLWQVRESGLGATAFVPGEPDSWPGWEDSAVPPDQVGPYLRGLKGLYAKYGFTASIYGHFLQGCIHTRIPFDLKRPEGIETYRRFTDEAADLCLRHGGALSGEHGDGQARGDLLVKMYGEALMQAMREFKAIWDPEGKMNPGKVVDARPRTADLRQPVLAHEMRPEPVFKYPDDRGDFRQATMRCVGIGLCRRDGEAAEGTMCPSYMVTREEMHTTRGRAHLLFEMVKGEVITDGWDSQEVKESLDLCLSCKGCTGDCPVHVDIPTLKAEFLHHHYKGKLRPRQAYAFGLIYRWARLGSLVPGLVNLAARTPGLRWLAKKAVNMPPERDIPKFASRTFKKAFGDKKRRGAGVRRVILWPDTFNNHFFPQTLMAAVHVLEDAGYHVLVPRKALCCGRPLYDFGMLDRAVKLWKETLEELGDEVMRGTPIVGVEPSCVAAFRDELPKLMPEDELAQRLSKQTHTLAELLIKDADYQPPHFYRRAIVHGHCHHEAIMGLDCDKQLYRRMRLEFEVLDSGCCGMAGAFGFEKGKYDISVAAGERVLLPRVREADDACLIIADGFSCREQVMQLTGRQPLHTAEVLHMALEASGWRRALPPGPEQTREERSLPAP